MTTDTRRRVKLYALNAERQWDDRGTGHVSSNYVDRLKGISEPAVSTLDISVTKYIFTILQAFHCWCEQKLTGRYF